MKEHINRRIMMASILVVTIGVVIGSTCPQCEGFRVGCNIGGLPLIICDAGNHPMCNVGEDTSEWECHMNSPGMLDGTALVWDPPSEQWVPLTASSGCQCGPYSTCWNDDTECNGNNG